MTASWANAVRRDPLSDPSDWALTPEHQALALEAGGIAVYEIDMSNGASVGNAVFYDLYGLPSDEGEVSFARWIDLVHPDDRDRVLDHVRQVLRGDSRPDLEYRIVRADGSTVWLAARTHHEVDAAGRHTRAWGVQRDVTAQRLAESALAARQAELDSLLSQEMVGISSRRFDGELIHMNRRFAAILGRTVDDLRHVVWREIIHPDDFPGMAALYARHLDDGVPFITESRFLTPTGEIVWAKMHVTIMRDAAGQPVSRLTVLDDITARKRAEEEEHRLLDKLEQASRLVTASTMGATLSHELQQPHAAIVNYLFAARLKLEHEGDRSGVRPMIEAAADQAMRAGDIVRHMRQFVSAGEPRASVQDLGQLVAEIIEVMPLVAEVRARIGTRLAGLPPVLVEPILIQQVLSNLIRNAIEAAPEGAIVVAAETAADGMVEVSVTDEGPGFAPEVEAHLFELFTSSKRGGLGLGLPISRSIVEAHGGKMWVRSAPGQTAVVFTLKMADQSNAVEAIAAIASKIGS